MRLTTEQNGIKWRSAAIGKVEFHIRVARRTAVINDVV